MRYPRTPATIAAKTPEASRSRRGERDAVILQILAEPERHVYPARQAAGEPMRPGESALAITIPCDDSRFMIIAAGGGGLIIASRSSAGKRNFEPQAAFAICSRFCRRGVGRLLVFGPSSRRHAWSCGVHGFSAARRIRASAVRACARWSLGLLVGLALVAGGGLTWSAVAVGSVRGKILFEGDVPAVAGGSQLGFGPTGLFVMNADGSGLQEIGPGAAAAWSPNGRQIVTAATASGCCGPGAAMVIENPDGTHRRTIFQTHSFGGIGSIAWSPTGSLIAFAPTIPVYLGAPTAANQVYVIHPNGSGLLKVTDLAGGAASPSFSRDGSTIAVEQFNDDVRQPPTIDVIRTNATGFLSLGLPTIGGGSPSWSPDGSTIAYTGSNGNIWGISPDGTGAHALTNTGPANPQGQCPIWSPDGTKFALVQIGLPLPTSSSSPVLGKLWELNADGSGLAQITGASTPIDMSGSTVCPDWTAGTVPAPRAPVRVARPVIRGVPIVSRTVRCSPPGRWSGSLPITISVGWSRNGAPVRGEVGAAYVIRAGDVGQRLSCSATAANQVGMATARSAIVIGDPSCRRAVGRALERCRARVSYDNARTVCNEIGTTTSHGRKLNRACVARAHRGYTRRLAVIHCQPITNPRQHAACITAQTHEKR